MRLALIAACATLMSGCGLVTGSSFKAEEEPPPYSFEAVAVPKAICQPGDQVETALQGQIPQSDRPPNSTRAASPYYCNLEEIGSLKGRAWATLDMYEDCAYYGVSPGAGGTQAVDISDSTLPLPGELLMTPAMQDPWESMKANNARALLAAGGHVGGNPMLDVYDLSIDCRAPVLKTSFPTIGAQGHEGFFAPDGMTYFMSALGAADAEGNFGYNLAAIDLSDPVVPSIVSRLHSVEGFHGGSVSDDHSRAYICQYAGDLPNGLLILDTTDVQARKPGAQFRAVSFTPIPENGACQAAYRVEYKGHPYAIVYGEMAGEGACGSAGPPLSNFAIPVIIDIADELNPKIVSRLMLEVDLPENCNLVAGDGTGFVYDAHHCTPDRLHDPTILACGHFMAGLRVFDIRDPLKPKELAYYNVSQTSGSFGIQNLGTIARPVVRADRGEIYFTNELTGFHVVKFAEGVWPWPESVQCPAEPDWLFTQQNPELDCS